MSPRKEKKNAWDIKFNINNMIPGHSLGASRVDKYDISTLSTRFLITLNFEFDQKINF